MCEAADVEWTSVAIPEESLQEGAHEGEIPRLFHSMLPRLRRVVSGMGFSGEAGEDILQDVFVAVLQRTAPHATRSQAIGWLVRVTTNRCLLEHRRRRRWRYVKEQITALTHRRPPAETGTPGDDLARSEEIGVMREVLDELEPSLLALVTLRYFCDLNATEIGEILQLPAGTVRSRLRDARLFLVQRMTEKGVGP